MSPIKAMPLLLTVLSPFVMTAGVAAAADAPLILAQFDPQKKDDHKPQSQPQPARPQAPQPHTAAPPQRIQQAPQVQQHNQGSSQPQQFRTQGVTPDAAKLHGQGSTQPQQFRTQGVAPDAVKPQLRTQGVAPDAAKPQLRTQSVAPDAAKPHGQGSAQPQLRAQGVAPDAAKPHGQGSTSQLRAQGVAPDAAKPHGQGSTQPQLHTQGVTPDAGKLHGAGVSPDAGKLHGPGVSPDAAKLHGPGVSPDAAKLHNDQVKIQQQQQQLQQAHRQEGVLRHELSAEEKRAKAERDAHASDRARLIEQQKQMALHEKSQAAINDRLRIQNERLRAISSQRQQSVDAHGQTIIREPGNRTILQVNGHAFIQHDETANFHAFGGIPQTRRGPNGNSISTIVRPDGVRIEVEVDGYGRPLRRVRYLPDGRRFVLFENRALAIGGALALGALIVSLPHVEVDVPPEQYIVDADAASEDDIYGALQAGPVVALDRSYSLEQVLASISLRERMRSINIDSINFDFGSADVPPDQAEMLESVAAVIRDMTSQNPGEVFLIEGHTDAVGSDVDNLSLSDRRAGAIADVLAQQFNVPRENLVTQGYGKQFLLVDTPEPERRNRRVVIRRITPLLQAEGGQYGAADGGAGDQDGR
jgi:outer membrane protein OmpA-like peptidoglycan-associated protein